MKTAKVFMSGNSQAVRLPKEFRVDAGEMQILRDGDTILLKPLPRDGAWLDAFVEKFGASFDDSAIGAALDRPGAEEEGDYQSPFD